jgi:DNA-binding Lrp family transcriptional regulator
MKLDNKDLKIITALNDNSRISIRNLAKKLNLRPSTVHQRIKKLVKNNVIEKFTLKLNNKAVGENFIVFLLVTTTKDLNSKFINNKHIKEVFGITGEYDLILKLKFKDVEEFNDFLLGLRKEHGIAKTLTMVVTANLKEVLN